MFQIHLYLKRDIGVYLNYERNQKEIVKTVLLIWLSLLTKHLLTLDL